MASSEIPSTPELRDSATLAEAVDIVREHYCPFIPVVDGSGKLTAVLDEDDLRLALAGRGRLHHSVSTLARPATSMPATPAAPQVTHALVMAGGRGERLRPLTDDTPKPLLPVGGSPLLLRVLGQLASAGVKQCFLSLHYLGDKVRSAVGDGASVGLDVAYLEETDPLGTAGALGLLPDSLRALDGGRLVVINGDILTNVNLTALFAWHERHGNRATVATHLWEVDVPFGLAHFQDQQLERLEEKPTLRLPVNAGVYVFDCDLLCEVPPGQRFDMVTWLNDLASRGLVGQFPIVEEWHDIGSLEAYHRLQPHALD
ncbi:MAG: hypothetical protein CMJ85_12615 [Planctomycetes bacterium]|nr:hypothetical protein [Planctomycetota bacterium]MDP6423963.1 sugar phosphate nucleotidyltransferase [Planctomycetota bacterium]